MVSIVRGEFILALADVAGSGAIGLFDPLVDFGTGVAEFVVVGFVVAAGRVAGVSTFAEVALVVTRTVVHLELEVVGSTFACPAGRVAGVLTLAEVTFFVRRTAVVLV